MRFNGKDRVIQVMPLSTTPSEKQTDVFDRIGRNFTVLSVSVQSVIIGEQKAKQRNKCDNYTNFQATQRCTRKEM